MAEDQGKLRRRELLLGSGAALSLVFYPPFAWAQGPSQAAEKKSGLQPDFNSDLLYRNEHPFGLSTDLRSKMSTACTEDPFHYYKYLTDETDLLKKRISEKIQMPEDQLYLSPGSGPALEKILHTIRDEKAHFAITDPDFHFLTRVAEYLKIKIHLVPTNSKFEVDLPALAKTNAEYIYFSNPHVPYGKAKSRAEIADFLKTLNKNTIVVVDEAYHDFSPRAEEISALPLVSGHKNLVVVRTFSKIYGMAALRMGYYATQNKKFSEYFTIYTVSALSAKVARWALDDKANFDRTYKYISETRKKVAAAAEQLGLKYIDSEANFMTLLTTESEKDAVVNLLKKQHYHLSSSQENKFLRFTLSTEDAVTDALNALTEAMKQKR